MLALTDTESRAIARDRRVTVVRPMDRREAKGAAHGIPPEPIAEAGDTLLGILPPGPQTHEEQLRGTFTKIEGRVVSVEAMRLHEAKMRMPEFFSSRIPFDVWWDDTYGHRHDWLYEANPRCWVVGVEQ